MNEAQYQGRLIKTLKQAFPDIVVIKQDSSYLQGIPDLLLLHEDKWAMLEVKASESAPVQPNQIFYVEQFNAMSYAAFIYPENEEMVLRALQRSFAPSRPTRISKRL